MALCVAAVGDAAYWGDGWELGSQIFATVEFLALPLVIAGAFLTRRRAELAVDLPGALVLNPGAPAKPSRANGGFAATPQPTSTVVLHRTGSRTDPRRIARTRAITASGDHR